MRRIVAFAVACILSIAVSGCGKKEETKEIKIEGPDGKGVKVEVK